MTDRDAAQNRGDSNGSDQPMGMQASVSEPATPIGGDRSLTQRVTEADLGARWICPDCGRELVMCRC